MNRKTAYSQKVKFSLRLACIITSIVACYVVTGFSIEQRVQIRNGTAGYFKNPVRNGADPWITKDKNFYNGCLIGSGKNSQDSISVSKSTTLGIWVAPGNGLANIK